MGNTPAEFETSDILGTTTTFTGAVGTTPTNVPASAGFSIEEFSIRCAVDQPASSRLEFSLDGGSNYIRLRVGEAREEEPRGRAVTQILIRAAGSLTTVNYEIVLNRGLL